MTGWTLVAIALITADAERRVERFEGVAIFEDGELTATATAAIKRRAATIPSGSQVTAVICLKTPRAPRATDVGPIGLRVVELARRAGSRLGVSWTARPEPTDRCPAGLLLEYRVPVARAAKVAWTRGEVHVTPADGKRRPPSAGEWLINGTTVATGDGRCGLLFADGSRVRLRPSTELTLGVRRDLREKKKRSWLKLSVGSIWARVSKLVGGSTFEVDTANVVAGVRGTDFAVTAEDGDEPRTRLETTEGTVAMTAGGETVVVEAGFGAAAIGDAPPRKVTLPTPPSDLQPNRGELRDAPFTWRGDATSYRVEVASDVQFTDLIAAETVTETRWRLKAPPVGELFWRVIAIDNDGFESRPSQLFRLKVSR